MTQILHTFGSDRVVSLIQHLFLSTGKVLASIQTESLPTCNQGAYSKIAVFFQNNNCCFSMKLNKKPRIWIVI